MVLLYHQINSFWPNIVIHNSHTVFCVQRISYLYSISKGFAENRNFSENDIYCRNATPNSLILKGKIFQDDNDRLSLLVKQRRSTNISRILAMHGSRQDISKDLQQSLHRYDFIILEEMFDLPLLSSKITSSLSKQMMTKLRQFKMPVLPVQIQHSLSKEFGEWLRATPWHSYSPIIPSFLEAYRLITEKILYEEGKKKMIIDSSNENSKKVFISNIHSSSQISVEDAKRKTNLKKEILKECDIMTKEIQTGKYYRYTSDYLISTLPNMDKLYSEKNNPSYKILQSASKALCRNPWIHPSLKSESLGIINSILMSGRGVAPS